MSKNYKHINKKGKGWGLKSMAMGAPTHDVSISIALNLKLSQSQVKAEELRIKNQIKEWWLESTLEPNHFICRIDIPSRYIHDRVVPMVFRIEIAVRTRKEIQMGATSFDEIFGDELNELIDTLGLEE